jgi:CysZ protein
MLGWALLPAGIAVGVGVTLSAAGVWGVVRISARFIAGGGGFAILGRLLFDLLFGGVVTFAAIVVALAIAQPLARAALDRIVTPLDERIAPLARTRPLQPSSGLASSLAVALSALGVTLPGVGLLELVTLFAPEAAFFTEPIAFAISALGLAWELLDHPFSRRGLTLGERLRWIRGRFFAVLGFATAAQVFLLIPGVDFFLLPIGIAGATRLFAESEEAGESRRGP